MHRWWNFQYSWSPSEVEELLSSTHACTNDIIYDPFAGAGITTTTAAIHGMKTISCDINPIAALTTEIKLNPPKCERTSTGLRYD